MCTIVDLNSRQEVFAPLPNEDMGSMKKLTKSSKKNKKSKSKKSKNDSPDSLEISRSFSEYLDEKPRISAKWSPVEDPDKSRKHTLFKSVKFVLKTLFMKSSDEIDT